VVSFTHSSRFPTITIILQGTHHKRKHPVLIKKTEVQQALGVGSTWMSEANHAVRLLRRFGEGGTSLHCGVIEMCKSTDENAKVGARALLEYLAEQE
jgi:hypothetical protein